MKNEPEDHQDPGSQAPGAGDSAPGDPGKPPRSRRRRRPRRNTRGPSPRLSWEQVRKLIDEHLKKLDRPALKQALIAAGIAAAAVLAIIALCKSVPLATAIVVVLGLGLVLRFWQEIRRFLGGA